MAIHVALHHLTRYAYAAPVSLGPQVVRLRPAPHCRTRILSYSLKVTPAKHFLNWQQDPQSNYLARLVFPDKTRLFSVQVDLVAEMAVYNPFDFFLEPSAERFPFEYDHGLDHELEPFRRRLEPTPRFREYLAEVRPKGPPPRTIDFLVEINRRVHAGIGYIIRLEPGVYTPDETLTRRQGSCRDSAWLLCQLLRHQGLAARFVSGYLIQLAPDQKPLDGPAGPAADFTDLHAWCEVYLPGAGWIGLDPTSGLLAGEGHIPLAATPDPSSAAPVTGMVDDCRCEFDFEMKVERIHETPRVTRPYREDDWQRILLTGREIDTRLRRAGCRLSMGGEPTFVSIDDMEGAEWNTVALGPGKQARADDLIRRLKKRFGPGALLHYGQGKWYPGESLPRWAYACYWRKDGTPIWLNDSLFAAQTRNYGFGAGRAEEFMRRLAGELGCDQKHITPAFEDAWYYLWKENQLPANLDPFHPSLQDEEERARLARVLAQGLHTPVGQVLPLRRDHRPDGPGWLSGPWMTRAGRCCLIPGDSPMGLRLPLESLPYVSGADYPHLVEQDPLEARTPLPPRSRGQRAQPGREADPRQRRQRIHPQELGEEHTHDDPECTPARGQSASWVIRTALCVEPRQGRLHVFMPPVRTLEDYLDLVAAVENTAESLDTPVVVEGYTPPHDSRLNVLKVTPDPGVLEVNIHPAQSWDELVENTKALYEDARAARLGTEKFMLDGRHTGTGGGNHIVVGGPSPAESPFLQRPDLLRSLVAFWQNHPSLSYLFSGLFIGPTSQSPRVDEARNDSLYELELAFRQVEPGKPCPPWLVDRLFRNLLTDATGNTHRAEFCIDKLYSPESASGRLGLVEMRAFEMPPHAEMSLAQQLVLRGLIARFWEEPYTQPLVRWGAQIHDRWLLPHFVWQDFQDVIGELKTAGMPVEPGWFTPHFEFRFPRVGEVAHRELSMELRQALEPWHVLGEEPGAGGTVRYVDSSVERLQVKMRGLVDGRYALACNGRQVPLHPTGSAGEFVAGVRYRAWQPPNCLHPNLPVNSPLVFNIVDTWNRRSVAGCTHNVQHPGGRNYSTFPVNAFEAESRRLSRFTPSGQVNAPMPLAIAPSPEFPFTLDLRRT